MLTVLKTENSALVEKHTCSDKDAGDCKNGDVKIQIAATCEGSSCDTTLKQEPISILTPISSEYDSNIKIEAEEIISDSPTDFSSNGDHVQSCISSTEEYLNESPEYGSFSRSIASTGNALKNELEWYDVASSIKVEPNDSSTEIMEAHADGHINQRSTNVSISVDSSVLKKYSIQPCRVVLERIDQSTASKPGVDVDYTCHNCGATFSRKEILKVHIYEHCQRRYSIKAMFTCDHCKSTFYRKSNLLTHITYHCPSYRRPIYGKSTGPGYYRRRLHPEVGDIERRLPECHDCGKYFSRIDTLKVHLRSKAHARKLEMNSLVDGKSLKAAKPAVVVCDCCHNEFTKSALWMHRYRCKKAKANPNKGKVCKICGVSFGDSYDFNRHMRWAHVKKLSKQMCCNDCGRTFKHVYELKRHIRSSQREGSKLHYFPTAKQ